MKYLKSNIPKVFMLILFLLGVPLIVDKCFSISLGFLAIHHVEASSVLEYLGAIIGGIFALVAIIVAVEQFSVDKQPIIVPVNFKLFLYNSFCSNQRVILTQPEIKQDLSYDIHIPHKIVLQNVTDNTSLLFSYQMDYGEGKFYHQICSLIGGESTEMYRSNYRTNKKSNLGVFNANSEREILLPDDLSGIIKNICYRLSDPMANDPDELNTRYNHFINKSYKVAEVTFELKDINRKNFELKYDVNIEISKLMCVQANYEILVSFISQEVCL